MSDISPLYSNLAHYYDLLCAETDYASQCEFAQRAFHVFTENTGKHYLDLACGSGAHLELMQPSGFSCNGLDNAKAMLELASLRCPNANFILADMASLNSERQYDLITCFLYSLHYNQPHVTMVTVLQNIFRALKPGGVFIFNTVAASGISNDNGVTTYLDHDNSKLSFQSAWHYSGNGEVMTLNLKITADAAGEKQSWKDQHLMCACSLQQMHSWLTNCGFDVHLLEHDYQRLIPHDGTSPNALIAACRPG